MSRKTPYGTLLSTDPAVQTDISLTTDYVYELSLIRIPLVTGGAGTRAITIQITANSNIIYNVPISADITTADTWEIMIGHGLSHSLTGTTYTLPLPEKLRLPRGSVIATSSTGLTASDNFGAAVLFVDHLD
ncbi:hypothetical protein LCGC14_0617780 [marine sediment metagenome]|uniref:Uncharacterized protein n=1 Tax=marine sediment metagenome TaxID=412755 RepID=A0A0F9TS55_9ZZZZ